MDFNLRRYDTQARFGLLLSLLAAACMGVMIAGIWHFSFGDWTPVYGPTRKVGVLASGLVAILLAAGGFGLGLNSAGQRRNDKPNLSWLSFFLGAAVLCLTAILLFFFLTQGQPSAH